MSESITFACTACGQGLEADLADTGAAVACPVCGVRIVVPGVAAVGRSSSPPVWKIALGVALGIAALPVAMYIVLMIFGAGGDMVRAWIFAGQ